MNDFDYCMLKALPDFGKVFSDGYYTGKSYIYQNAKYAVVVNDINQAKLYSSYSRALTAHNRLSFENYDFEIVRLSDYNCFERDS